MLSDIAQALLCSNAQSLLSIEGLMALGRGGGWWQWPPAMMLWIWVLICAIEDPLVLSLALCLACVCRVTVTCPYVAERLCEPEALSATAILDLRESQKLPWEHRLLVTRASLAQTSMSLATESKASKRSSASVGQVAKLCGHASGGTALLAHNRSELTRFGVTASASASARSPYPNEILSLQRSNHCGSSYQVQLGTAPLKLKLKHQRWQEASEASGAGFSISGAIFKMMNDAPNAVVTKCVRMVHARKASIDEDCLRLVLAMGQVKDLPGMPRGILPQPESVRSTITNIAEQRGIRDRGKEAVNTFLETSFLKRVAILMPAVHPLVT
ncbi:unnamed protein product [Polarella glacialis]|uniref:Uncharacterized protein n=1 Tax=Polarella glacialis TaxID=89957 RepID=A0A813EF12_POLGL|nr:unnamed protein product [Polarella glacialis]